MGVIFQSEINNISHKRVRIKSTKIRVNAYKIRPNNWKLLS